MSTTSPKLIEELTILCTEQPAGIERLLTAIEQRKIDGSLYCSTSHPGCGCAYWHIAGQEGMMEASNLEEQIARRLHMEEGVLPPLAEMVIPLHPDTTPIPYQGLKDLYDLIISIREKVAASPQKPVAQSLYETPISEGEQGQ